MKKPLIFDEAYYLELQKLDLTYPAHTGYELIPGVTNLALNSLGAMHKNAKLYCDIFLEHWKTYQVEGHFIPMTGIGTNPTGYADFREMFRGYATRLLGAKHAGETAIVNDQSTAYSILFRWLAEVQVHRRRTVILYEKSAFPSDKILIETLSEIIFYHAPHGPEYIPKLIAIPETEDGLLDYPGLLELIETYKEVLGLVAFGSGGVHWKTAELLDLKTIGKAIKDVGGKLLVNVAHAIGIADLHLHEYNVTAAVGCLYKFMSAGPGGPSLVFIHEEQSVEYLPSIGWFSYEHPIDTLQGKVSTLKTNAQRIEASNPLVLGWLPAYAAMENYCTYSREIIQQKTNMLLASFDELMQAIQDNFSNPIRVITPNTRRATEIVFTTTNPDLASKLHQFLNDKKVICDIRDGNRIRIGMFPLITSFKDLSRLFNEMWNFFEIQ